LAGDIDHTGRGALVAGRNAGDTGRGQRTEAGALPGADQDHRQGHAGEVRGIGAPIGSIG
jgi:hypothetical protein